MTNICLHIFVRVNKIPVDHSRHKLFAGQLHKVFGVVFWQIRKMHIPHRSGLLNLHPAEHLILDGIDAHRHQVSIVTLANISFLRRTGHRHAGFASALAGEYTARSSWTREPVDFIGAMAHSILPLGPACPGDF